MYILHPLVMAPIALKLLNMISYILCVCFRPRTKSEYDKEEKLSEKEKQLADKEAEVWHHPTFPRRLPSFGETEEKKNFTI